MNIAVSFAGYAFSSISGGSNNLAGGIAGSISGGFANLAGDYSSTCHL